jgi:hypothetical protein
MVRASQRLSYPLDIIELIFEIMAQKWRDEGQQERRHAADGGTAVGKTAVEGRR